MDLPLALSLVGLALCLSMMGVTVLAGLKRGGRKPFLALVFLEAALYFLGESASSLFGRSAFTVVLSFASMFYGVPSLYLFAREAMGVAGGRALVHYLPAILNIPIGAAAAIGVASNGFRGGAAIAAYIAVLELGEAAQLVLYGRRALALCRDAGFPRPWARRVIVSGLCGYAAFLLLDWISFGTMLVGEATGRDLRMPAGYSSFPVVVSVLLAWTLGLCAIWGGDYASMASVEARKYGGRPLSPAEARDILERARRLIDSEKDLSSAAVEPRRLAERIGEPYYLLSRAVNETEGMSVADLVNEHRTARALRLLASRPDLPILDVAMEAGFQSKSTFNAVFKRRMGSTPSEYRARAKTPEATRPSPM